jgi:hypothetical protein
MLVRTYRLPCFDTTRAAQKMAPPAILRCRGNVFTKPLLSNDKGIHSSINSSELLLALASTVILGSEYQGTHDHILLCDGSGSFHTIASAVHVHRQTGYPSIEH